MLQRISDMYKGLASGARFLAENLYLAELM